MSDVDVSQSPLQMFVSRHWLLCCSRVRALEIGLLRIRESLRFNMHEPTGTAEAQMYVQFRAKKYAKRCCPLTLQ